MNPDSYNQPQDNTRLMIRIALIVVGLSIMVLVLNWLYGHAYIAVSATNASSSNVTFSLTNQKSKKTITVTGAGTTTKKLVPRGDYEVVVQQDSTSYLTVIHSGSFLTTTSIQAQLSPEHARKFIGDNPGNCMFYSGQILLSSNCGNSFSDVDVHTPATSDQPTFIQKTDSNIDGTVEGFITLNGAAFVLIQSNDSGAHTLYKLQNDLTLTEPHLLSNLDNNTSYSIQAYKDGFVVYTATSEDFLYYTSVTATPSTISMDKSVAKDFEPYAQKIENNSLLVAYTNVPDSPDASKVTHPKTTVVVATNGNLSTYVFNKQYGDMSLCAQTSLCLLANGQLDVYDISNAQSVFQYSLSNVQSMAVTTHGFVVVKDQGVFEFNPTNRSGFLSYSFGDYSYCGLQLDGDANGYSLCLTNNKGKKVALHIDPNSTANDTIDKQIAALLKLPSINNVSIYDKYIFISPNVGDPVYVDSLQGFDYDPVVKKQAYDAIDQYIQVLGIDTSTYHIIHAL